MRDKLFVVGGATSGFGRAVAEALVSEGAHVIGVARTAEALTAVHAELGDCFEGMPADLSAPDDYVKVWQKVGNRPLHGVLVNAGGPPAKTVLETTLADWDDAYIKLLRWKVAFAQESLRRMIPYGYGRLVFVESASVKQPIENLVLSNALRMAVVGFVKTFSHEVARTGVTLNVLGPGSHNTPAIDRLYRKKSEQTGLPFEEVRQAGIGQIPVGALGEADDLASLALWLLSPQSRYITGQTITVDGGAVKGSFG